MSTSPRLKDARRDWGHDATGCVIEHIDMDAFFSSCEIARHPELAGKPVIVGTGNRAVVSTASYEARKYGVNSAMPVASARRLCPNGIFLPVDMAYYHAMSRRVFAIFEEVTPRIEKVSVDEGYIDVSTALDRWAGGPEQIGRWIRRQVRERLHVTCSVGIASNKLISKLASTNAKPDGLLLIPKARSAEFIQLMPVRAVPGVGPSTEKALAAWGCSTVAQMAQMTESQLTQATGSRSEARRLWLAARGEDDRKLVIDAPEKSIGSERTFDEDQTELGPVAGLVRSCCDGVASRMRARGVVGHTVSVKLRFEDLQYITRSRTFDKPLDTASEIYPRARALLCEMMRLPQEAGVHARMYRPIRLAGVAVSSLEPADTAVYEPTLGDLLGQGSDSDTGMTPDALDKANKVEKSLDSVRQRFGKGSVRFGI